MGSFLFLQRYGARDRIGHTKLGTDLLQHVLDTIQKANQHRTSIDQRFLGVPFAYKTIGDPFCSDQPTRLVFRWSFEFSEFTNDHISKFWFTLKPDDVHIFQNVFS
ncbi:MAG: hypothetical protein CMN54_15165 [SAR324 cluster bacterium]|uniref:Uncharacterized protein n=1 Tax=SAR324 cluster bacterium TaxID=2024889 RepID=A0A2D6YNH0_9DELT|nr:hypothetical protein [SAR324 cluster bacterium]